MSALFGGTHSVFDTVIQFFREDDWNFHQIDGKPILKMGFSGEDDDWRCYAQARNDKQQFIFYSVMGSRVPADKRQAVAEYLTRANYGLVVGNFEMDFSDGEVRYKTSIDVEGGRLTQQMVRALVYVNVLMMNKYLPGIKSVVYADASPSEMVAQIES